MKHLKNYISLALIACMILTFASCGVPKNTVFDKGDLKGKKIGVQSGTTGEYCAKDVKATDKKSDKVKTVVEGYTNGTDAIQALKQGKVDCVIIDQETAKAFVKNNNDLKILNDKYDAEEYAMCISKNNAELKSKVNSALSQLKTNGTLDKIIKNYIGDETIGTYKYKSPKDVNRSNGTLTMATNANFPPYEYLSKEKVVGIDVDMAQAIADILGMKLVIKNMNFDSIILSVQTGKSDIGVAGMTVTEERLKTVDFTDTYAKSTQVIIVRAK